MRRVTFNSTQENDKGWGVLVISRAHGGGSAILPASLNWLLEAHFSPTGLVVLHEENVLSCQYDETHPWLCGAFACGCTFPDVLAC